MDQMLTEYSTKRRTLRWPLAFFFNIIDIAALASYIITTANLEAVVKTKSDARRKYLQNLARALVLPNVMTRADNQNIWAHQFSTQSGLECMLGRQLTGGPSLAPKRDAQGRIKQLGKCVFCKKRRPARKRCYSCQKLICAEHTSPFIGKCTTCSE